MSSRTLVDENEWLFRRSYSNPLKRFENPDGTATSRVFKLRENDNGELSVDVKSLTTATISLKDPEKFILFEISNKSIIECELTTLHDPLSDGSNDSHSVIVGMTIDDEISPGLLARKSKRIYLI